MKAKLRTEEYFPVVLFIMFKMVLTVESMDEILKCGHAFKIKATEQYFPVVLFIMFKGGSKLFRLCWKCDPYLQHSYFSCGCCHIILQVVATVV